MISSPVILFDGVCNLCNSAVQFVLKRDKEKVFRFASLQSAAGAEFLKKYDLPEDYINSFVLIENDKAYNESTAALRVTRHLKGGWKLMYGFIIVPKFIRDAVYRFIARNRYKWFGKRDECMLPTADLRGRFLE